MKQIAAVFATVAALCTYGAPAHAQGIRTWVSGVGDDANPCSRFAPCKTFAAAMSRTTINGEINCLDSGGFGTVTITKSITIDCHEHFASILSGVADGIIISIPIVAEDPLRTARLRNININGTGLTGKVGGRVGLNGIRILQANVVYLEDMMISSFTQRGLSDERTASGKVFVKNSTFRDNGQSGFVILPSAGQAMIDAVIEGSQFIGNINGGIAVSNGARVLVKRSVMSGNAIGIDAEGTSGTQLSVDDSHVSQNGTGFFQGDSAVIRISNSDIAFNTALGGGTINSFTNNRFIGNGAGGTVAAIGAVTDPTGQQ